jgi:hypothetical protein
MQLHSKSGFIFTITLIREYIIQHQDIKDPLQQFYRNIALGSEAFIELNISLHFLWLRLASFLRWITWLFLKLLKDSSKKVKTIIK